jgi:hypothetical protein
MKLFKRKPEAMEVDQEELLNEIEQVNVISYLTQMTTNSVVDLRLVLQF